MDGPMVQHHLVLLLGRLGRQDRGDRGALVVVAAGNKFAPHGVADGLLNRALGVGRDLHDLLRGVVGGVAGERGDRAHYVFILPAFPGMDRQFDRAILRHLLGLRIHHVGQVRVV